MYTFMDDYGDEWGITTFNPFYGHHFFIELAREEEWEHEIRTTSDGAEWCICGHGYSKGAVWSQIMSRSEDEVEWSYEWQAEKYEAELEVYRQQYWAEIDEMLGNGTWTQELEDARTAMFIKRRAVLAQTYYERFPEEFSEEYPVVARQVLELTTAN